MSTAYFDKETQRALLEKHLVKQSVEDLPLPLARLMWEIFAQVGSKKEEHCQSMQVQVHMCSCVPGAVFMSMQLPNNQRPVPCKPSILSHRGVWHSMQQTLCPCRSMWR